MGEVWASDEGKGRGALLLPPPPPDPGGEGGGVWLPGWANNLRKPPGAALPRRGGSGFLQRRKYAS